MLVEFGDLALAEIEAAALHYESEYPGRGLRFLDELREATTQLGAFPRAGAVCGDALAELDLRRLQVPRFPYQLLYRLRPHPFVIAVAHHRQEPLYFVDRLGEPTS